MAYLFLLMLVFSSGPNLSGTPHRGRLIALATVHVTGNGYSVVHTLCHLFDPLYVDVDLDVGSYVFINVFITFIYYILL